MLLRFAIMGCALFLALGTSVVPVRAEVPKVVASVQPLGSLVAAVMSGVAPPPAVLVSGATSEHGYSLKPSQARAVREADLLVFVSPDYEGFLAPLLVDRAPSSLLAMAEQEGMLRLPWRDDEGNDGHDNHEGHNHGALDGHMWLDPDNAKVFVRALAQRLSELDPEHAAAYRTNAEQTVERLATLDRDLMVRLAAVRQVPFIVFHDAWQYFQRHYGLSLRGVVTLDPDLPPSAKHLAQLRRDMRESGVVCLFHEPQFPSPLVTQLVADTGIRSGILDPQGAALPLDADQYFTLMMNLANGLQQCLTTKIP